MYELFAIALFALYTGTLSNPVDNKGQFDSRKLPGNSIVKLCPESQDDVLVIERIVNKPQIPYLNEEEDVFIWGNFTRDIPAASTVDYQINATANTGDFGALNGTFHICDYLEQMHQPPESNEPEKACPPSKGPVFINYAAWFADFLVAPGQWSVKFDAKMPGGDRIYCLQAEFDLQCPPWHDGPECLRDNRKTVDIGDILTGRKERMARRNVAGQWPLPA